MLSGNILYTLTILILFLKICKCFEFNTTAVWIPFLLVLWTLSSMKCFLSFSILWDHRHDYNCVLLRVSWHWKLLFLYPISWVITLQSSLWICLVGEPVENGITKNRKSNLNTCIIHKCEGALLQVLSQTRSAISFTLSEYSKCAPFHLYNKWSLQTTASSLPSPRLVIATFVNFIHFSNV